MSEQKTQQHDANGDHITPLSTYLKVAGALFVLTVITVAVSQVDFGPWNLVVAMIIASTKAVLVALFFMHLLYDNKIYGAMFSASLVFLGLFIILTMFDTMARGDISAEEARPINARAVIYGEDGKPLKKNKHDASAEHGEEADSMSHEETGVSAPEGEEGDAGHGADAGH